SIAREREDSYDRAGRSERDPREPANLELLEAGLDGTTTRFRPGPEERTPRSDDLARERRSQRGTRPAVLRVGGSPLGPGGSPQHRPAPSPAHEADRGERHAELAPELLRDGVQDLSRLPGAEGSPCHGVEDLKLP